MTLILSRTVLPLALLVGASFVGASPASAAETAAEANSICVTTPALSGTVTVPSETVCVPAP